MTKKLISIISPCFNEEDNIKELYGRVVRIMDTLIEYDFEYLFVDNASTDDTLIRLKRIANSDPRVKIIVNNRNYGHIRSPYWGIIQTVGDATVYLASDLQDPPELIPDLIKKWAEGAEIVLATKPVSATNPMIHCLRRLYYKVLDAISDVEIVRDSTGFGIYDRKVIQAIRQINDPYPFLRGLICELGFDIKKIDFNQPPRKRGLSKNNFYTLYDIAWLGFVSHSKIPLRLASFFGISIGFLSLLAAMIAFIVKLVWWEKIPIGISPIIIGMFLMFGLVLLFIGIVGEYLAAVLAYVQKRPIVVEKERINM